MSGLGGSAMFLAPCPPAKNGPAVFNFLASPPVYVTDRRLQPFGFFGALTRRLLCASSMFLTLSSKNSVPGLSASARPKPSLRARVLHFDDPVSVGCQQQEFVPNFMLGFVIFFGPARRSRVSRNR
eukprot:3009234-Pyramimonas_sp.AAC.1